MNKTILITGSTDGIGFEAAKLFHSLGHRVLIHGRSPAKIERALAAILDQGGQSEVESYAADLSDLTAVRELAQAVAEKHASLDVLINNAGVYLAPETRTADGLDVRFVVNTIAPYLLTRELLPRMSETGRVVNLSSAAQSTVDLSALQGKRTLSDSAAYAQSKLALTMWSRSLAELLEDNGPAVIAVNPGSMLATKMVKEAYGVAGADIRVGAEILERAALAEEFGAASGQYFDNDVGAFAPPHPDGLDEEKCLSVVGAVESILAS